MTYIDIENICRLAAVFEEETAPATLPAGAVPLDYKGKFHTTVEETLPPPSPRLSFEKNITVPAIKDLMLRVHKIFTLSKGAFNVLASMNKDRILSPVDGIDSYFEPMEQELNDIFDIVGRKI